MLLNKYSIEKTVSSTNFIKIYVNLNSPLLIIPFDLTQINNCECWVINFGNLEIKNDENILNFDEFYKMKLKSINLMHSPSIKFFNEKFHNEKLYKILENFCIDMEILISKKNIKKNEIFYKIKGKIPAVELKLKKEIYDKLIKINECFQVNKSKNLFSHPEKRTIMKNAKKFGEIWVKTNVINTWVKFYGCLSGNYIYFFQNPKDKKSQKKIYARGLTVQRIDDNLKKNCFFVLK